MQAACALPQQLPLPNRPSPAGSPPPKHPTVLRATMYGRPTSEYIYSRPLQQSASPPHDERSHTAQIYAYPVHPSLYHSSQQELDSAYYPQEPQLQSPPAIYGPPLVQQQPPPMAHQWSMQPRSIPANFVDDPAFSTDPHANPLTHYPTFAMNSREEIVPMGNQVSTRFPLGPFYLCTLAPTLLFNPHMWPFAHFVSLFIFIVLFREHSLSRKCARARPCRYIWSTTGRSARPICKWVHADSVNSVTSSPALASPASKRR